jgi:hypothetical protein
MSEATRSMPPNGWRDAFAALPLDAPPADGWSRVAARLDARRRRLPLWLATAAALVLAIALPWQLQRRPTPVRFAPAPATVATTTPATGTAMDRLHALQAESARLEALLQLARDERVSSATAAALAGELDARVAGIDAALMQPTLSADQQLALWQDRVDALRSVAGFEGTRRWLVANGSRYDGALVRID